MSILSADMIGDSCSFRTINPNDTTTYTGVIEDPFTSYNVVKPFRDVMPYNTAVRQADSSITSDVSKLHYFLISVVNSEGDTELVGFAEEWIQEGSFTLLDKLVKRTFTVYSPSTTSSQDILNVLRSAGYSATDTTSD